MGLENQRQFIRAVKTKCNMTWRELGALCGVKGPTVKINYYLRGKTIPLAAALQLSSASEIGLPPHELLPDNWGQIKGGSVISHDSASKNPGLCKDLAELVGVLFGDGCIFRSYDKSEGKYVFFTMSTGHLHDFEYYRFAIRPIVKKLFDVSGCIYLRQNTVIFAIKSKRIYEFLKSIGMPEGEKVKNEPLLIPRWIMSSAEFLKAFIRGVTDTDGSIFKDHENYLRIQYKFASESFLKCLHGALARLGYQPTNVARVESFHPRRQKTYVSWRFYLGKQKEIERFVNEIGFRNSWHKRRYSNFVFSKADSRSVDPQGRQGSNPCPGAIVF